MKKTISIIGGGTASLFLAAFLDTDIFKVTIFERKKTLGRKFLVAGDGGFNLTHSESIDKMISRYTPNDFLNNALIQFSNDDLISWLSEIGIPTFVGSSKRIFPEKRIKPIDVLKSIKAFLIDKGISFKFNKEFCGWNENNALVFNSEEIINSDYNVFSLGGSSWKITGSDGNWNNIFANKGIKTKTFLAQNCAFQVNWTHDFLSKHEGQPLKNISMYMGNQVQKGEVVITKFGIEGNAIYALSPKIQMALSLEKVATVYVDFKPTVTHDVLLDKLIKSTYNISQTLKRIFKLNAAQIDMIKNVLTKEEFLDNRILIGFIKKFPLSITDSAPIDEAISTSGGVELDAINENYELIDMNGNYCIGEMLDWNAPTGGYLIQGCVSMGVDLARKLNEKAKLIG